MGGGVRERMRERMRESSELRVIKVKEVGEGGRRRRGKGAREMREMFGYSTTQTVGDTHQQKRAPPPRTYPLGQSCCEPRTFSISFIQLSTAVKLSLFVMS